MTRKERRLDSGIIRIPIAFLFLTLAFCYQANKRECQKKANLNKSARRLRSDCGH